MSDPSKKGAMETKTMTMTMAMAMAKQARVVNETPVLGEVLVMTWETRVDVRAWWCPELPGFTPRFSGEPWHYITATLDKKDVTLTKRRIYKTQAEAEVGHREVVSDEATYRDWGTALTLEVQ